MTARSLARAFTYEVGEEVSKGAIVAIPFGRRRARGVVVAIEDAAPTGIDVVPIEGVVGEVSPALVDLALWLADYYGSTPARALVLVAPESPKRRKIQEPPGERQSLTGEPEPHTLSEPQVAAIARIVAALDSGGGNFLLHGVTGSGKTAV